MSTLPSLPKGIERDDTEHGRIYFTRAQMLEYGKRCADDCVAKIGASSRADDEYNGDFGALIRGFAARGRK